MSTDQEIIEERKPTRFQSPVPALIQFRNFIFGKTKPDAYTRVTFYMNLIIWITFMFWNVASYFTIASRQLILSQKGIDVAEIITNRGIELGFEDGDFLSRLLTFHGVSIICWGIIFIGLVLLYRKRSAFIYFILGGLIFYVGMSMFYLNFSYFVEDTTTYDKIALLIMITSTVLHSFLMKNERSGGSISLFGEVEEDESTPQ